MKLFRISDPKTGRLWHVATRNNEQERALLDSLAKRGLLWRVVTKI
jgi:hypothetical protein